MRNHVSEKLRFINSSKKKDSETKFKRWSLLLIDFLYASFSIKECANHNWMDLFHNFSAIPLWCEEEFVNGHYCRTMCPTQKWRTQWGQCVLRLKNEGHNEDIVCEIHRGSCAPKVNRGNIFGWQNFYLGFPFTSIWDTKIDLPQKKERLS